MTTCSNWLTRLLLLILALAPALCAVGRVSAQGGGLSADALLIDPVTLRHLNVVEGVDGGRTGSLLDEIDRTATAMGGRLIRAWLVRPLVALARIQDRLDAVEDFAFHATDRAKRFPTSTKRRVGSGARQSAHDASATPTRPRDVGRGAGQRHSHRPLALS